MHYNHLKEVNMTYKEHLIYSLYNSVYLIYSGILGVFHSFIPYIFVTNQSDCVNYLYIKMNNKKSIGLSKIKDT